LFNDVGGIATVLDSTISGNNSQKNGAGISAQASSSTTLVNTTIVNNRADSDNNGSGDAAIQALGTFVLRNTIVAGNVRGSGTTASDLSGSFTANNNLIGDPATAGGIANGVNGNIVGKDNDNNPATARVVWPIAEIVSTTLAANGGTTRTHALAAG